MRNSILLLHPLQKFVLNWIKINLIGINWNRFSILYLSFRLLNRPIEPFQLVHRYSFVYLRKTSNVSVRDSTKRLQQIVMSSRV